MDSKLTYTTIHKVSAISMILMLLWLTISAPFVLAAKQEMAKQESKAIALSAMAGCEEESSNPFGNSEEKSSKTSTSVSEEYMHDYNKSAYMFSISLQGHNSELNNLYSSHKVELLSPPPERM